MSHANCPFKVWLTPKLRGFAFFACSPMSHADVVVMLSCSEQENDDLTRRIPQT